jgi:hypothetical protein
MPLSPSRVLRTFRYAMYFDGVDDYVSVSSPSINELGLSFSVMAWINYHRYSKTPSGCGDPSSSIASKRVAGVWEKAWVFNIAYVRLLSRGVSLSVPSVPLGEFHFVGFSRSLGSSITVFTDNRFASYSDPGTDERNTLALNIGRQVCLAEYAHGYISQVLAYTRALSDSEILFNYSNPDNPVRDGLVLWLRAHPDYIRDIDGDGLLEWLDLSGFNNHGKIYGARLVELIKTPARTLTTARTLTIVR